MPLGWSPITTVDVQPEGLAFGQAARLQVQNTLRLPAGSAVVIGFYDQRQHRWVAQAPAGVTADGQYLEASITATGQWTMLLPDPAPMTPPAPQIGQALLGVASVALPPGLTATGEVLPRSAPPGDGARAVGSVVVSLNNPLPSGTPVQAHVSEHYDLLDTSSVVPLPFTQDLLLYAQPRRGTAPSLNTRFPITPSRRFTVQELAFGMVRLEVTPPVSALHGTVIGPAGGLLTGIDGNTLEIPASGLPAHTVVDLFPLTAAQVAVPLPGGFPFLGAVQVDLVGITLAQTAQVSFPRPSGLSDTAQVVIAQVITDPAGNRRLRLVALGQVQGTRIVSQTLVNGLRLPGIMTGGTYVALHASTPLGLVTGTVLAPTGNAPQAQAVVTANTAPFVDVTTPTGTYIIAGQAGGETLVTATDAQENTATGTVSLASANAVARLDLTLVVQQLMVLHTTPVDGATGVSLNAAVQIQFSKELEAASVTASSVMLHHNGTPIAGQRVLSADGRTVAFRPDAMLLSHTVYTLILTDAVHDQVGNALAPFTPISFTTLDTAKPPQPPAGQITAGLPDEDGLVLIFGTQGASIHGKAVTATNVRTQETVTVLALEDGAFRLRIAAKPGDSLALTLRNAADQELTLAIDQFVDPDGSTALGAPGGSIAGPGGRVVSLLPRALSTPAVVKLDALDNTSSLPPLPAELSYVDSLTLTMQGGAFTRLQSLTVTEAQNRFAPQIAMAATFATAGSLVVPSNFLVNGQLKFAAVAQDATGQRQRVEGGSVVVGAQPVATRQEEALTERFPTVFLSVPSEAALNQQIEVQAIAPTARFDLTLPAPTGLTADVPLLLGRLAHLNSETTLAVVDRLSLTEVNGTPMLATVGRELPGAASGGHYVVLASAEPLVFVTGRATGPAVTVRVAGSPLVFETTGANAFFRVPVLANRPFTLHFVGPGSGQEVGTVTGQAPASGEVALGEPLAPPTGQLLVSVQPEASATVDINPPLVFSFSEPIDSHTVDTSILVTDPAGIRVFGTFVTSADATRVTFTPTRRWRFGTTYRYGVSTGLLARSGARLAQVFNGEFTTFAPRVLSNTRVDTVQDVAVAGTLALVGGTSGVSVLDITQADQPVLQHQMPLAGGAAGVALQGGASFNDRTGQPILGTIGLVASGNAATPGRLQVLNLNTPLTPVLLGAAQLTVPAGQSAPAGVPPAPGVPSTVVLGADQRAFVAVQSLGGETVQLDQAIPDDSANPGGALAERFPATGFESANQVVILDDKLLVVGSRGLTLLDSTTLAKLGNISTGGNAAGVAGMTDFSMDLNGDGALDQTTEIFPLTVVANGQDGTLQFLHDLEG